MERTIEKVLLAALVAFIIGVTALTNRYEIIAVGNYPTVMVFDRWKEQPYWCDSGTSLCRAQNISIAKNKSPVSTDQLIKDFNTRNRK